MLALIRVTVFILCCSCAAFADDYVADNLITPVRLSYAEGKVSFWRPGAPDWVNAYLNTPLAIGDALYVGTDGDLELQMGNRAFIRADDNTQLNLVNQTPNFIQFRVVSGRASFDLRQLPPGFSVEVDTPNAVFSIDHVGYYRVDVDDDVHFITRRGGLAIMTLAGANVLSIHPSEEIVVQGVAMAGAQTYVAPELDQWDRWNFERTESLLNAISDRYLPYGIAGAADLDHSGNWRVVPDYGSVWVPDDVPFGWAPYTSGRWLLDPDYQWTWIDDEPWGWAPFHYGRWVYLDGIWAWAPGPAIRHPEYSPALVVFFNMAPDRLNGNAALGWVALGWGEPVKPWWGKTGFIGRPWWGGWGGPRLMNNRGGSNANDYNNIHVQHALIATAHEHFGKGHVHDAPVHITRPDELEHIRGPVPVKPAADSLVAGAMAGARPPEKVLSRQVFGTAAPGASKLPWIDRQREASPNIVPLPKPTSKNLARPDFGIQTGAERFRPMLPPSFMERRNAPEQRVPESMPHSDQMVHKVPGPAASSEPHIMHEHAPAALESGHAPLPRKPEATQTAPHAAQTAQPAKLPGLPANRVYQKDQEHEPVYK